VSESPVEELASHAVPGTFRPVDAVRAITAAARDSIIVGDATTAGGLLARNVRITDADSFFVSSSGSLGWGLGASLGIALGRPDRPVVAVLGDGVFQFGLPGLWTAAHYHIPVAFVVLNNRRYAAVGAALRRFGGRAVAANSWPGTDISGVDIVGISKAFGIAAKRVADLTELDDLLSTGRPEPIVIEVLTDPDDFGP
jgi:benzoylformate decarboxylase